MWTTGPADSFDAERRYLVWGLAGLPLAIAIVMIVSFSAGGAGNPEEPERFPGIDSLHVTTDHGDVEIVGIDGGDVLVTRRAQGDAPRAESWGGGSLTIGQVCDESLVCTSLRDTPQDHTDYVLHVPRDLDVTVHSRNGDITLRGLRGRVDARAADGTVHRDPPTPAPSPSGTA
ncbi:hypothetical protein [Planobispora takensis]|uniref:Uncharacterized protein n=1 Tax=Planobispora takensis TaxID=1367882 RepID=A0A8J3WY66_9ACTN|nr:hypothetical protein [Planobispora takensis]GII05588.1 hypothetical protein Pta02_75960 [Planobispora takensis]